MMTKKYNFSRLTAVISQAAIFFSLISVLCLIEADARPQKSAPAVKTSAEAAAPEEKPAESPESGTGEAVKETAKEGAAAKSRADEPLAEYSAEDFGPKVEEESYAWTIFKLLFVLGLMGGGFYYFFRFVTKKAGISILGQDVANVLSIVPVGQNKYLQVIDIAGRVLVLGVSDAGINLITEITAKDEIDRIRLLSSKSPEPDRPVFNDYLVNIISGIAGRISSLKKSRGKSINRDNNETDNLDYLTRQRDRLKKINGNRDE
jgi:flagellar protein FliO/FliZ